MRNSVVASVWAYMLVAVIAEVESFYGLANGAALTAVVTILATSQAVAIILFYMHLKDEPGSVRLFALIPIMFLSALFIAMLASLG
ncbi:MAG TPA: cytochrome C oxidase subunit IV family protein [Nitrososphaerales archaeon]|nr:cytochrome C oxidase subunit IV family protein [Nitrososphaerales archaeon]